MKLPFRRPRIEDLDRYLANKQYDKALTAVADGLRRHPEQFNVLLRKAEILGMAGNTERAIEVYRKLAAELAHEGFHARAIALYKEVLRLDPSQSDVHGELARLIETESRLNPPLEQELELCNEDFGHEAGAESPTEAPPGADEAHHDDSPQGATTGQQMSPETASQPTQAKELRASALFASFHEQALEQVLTSTALRSYAEGDIIVTEGEQGSSLFLIVSGTVKVFTRGERGEHLPLAELGPGDFFGEVSLLTGKPRTATITAKEKVLAIELTKEDVDRIAEEHTEVHKVLEDFYTRRAHETVEAVIRRMRGSG